MTVEDYSTISVNELVYSQRMCLADANAANQNDSDVALLGRVLAGNHKFTSIPFVYSLSVYSSAA